MTQQQQQTQPPKGFRWEPTQNKYIPILESPVFKNCAPGWKKDPVTLECVPILPQPPIAPLPPTTNPNPTVVKIAMGGDSKAEQTFDSLCAAIVKESPHHFVFLGDTSYNDNEAKSWTQIVDKHGLKKIMAFLKGNHEDNEEDAQGAEADLLTYFK